MVYNKIIFYETYSHYSLVHLSTFIYSLNFGFQLII